MSRTGSRHNLAKSLAEKYGLYKADRYDLCERFDGLYDVIAYVVDPTIAPEEYVGAELLTPMRWLTIGVVDKKYKLVS